jgi:hypothetical protein
MRDGHISGIVEGFFDAGEGLTVWFVPEEIGFQFALRGLVLAAAAVRV